MQSLITHRLLLDSLSHTMKKSKGFVMTGNWEIDKTVSVGHIVSTIGLIVLLFTAWANMSTKVETQAVRIDGVEQRIDREAARQRQDMEQIRQSLNRIEDRLERLSEAQ